MEMKSKRWFLFLLFLLIPFTAILTQCIGTAASADPRGQGYAGAKTCIKCHNQVYEAHLNTWHNNSSRTASLNNIHGSFTDGQNSFAFSDSLKVVMRNTNGRLYQSAYFNGVLQQQQPFDIAFGGKKAETYLYWNNSRLFELPISYFNNLHSWTNSPGYAGGKVNFTRPIVKRCFECHSSYIAETEAEGQSLREKTRFDKKSLIYGIDCERCHGPAARHVEFHTDNPDQRKPAFMTSFKGLTRSQKMDACAVCHSGNKDTYLTTIFNFKMGDTLSHFIEPSFSRPQVDAATLDVHGNQFALLSASKCFKLSEMDCTTCHNPHSNTTNVISYARICMSCHQPAKHNECKLATKLGASLVSKCIDCHMPAQPSDAIRVESQGGKMVVPYLVRNHFIKVYKENEK